MHPGSEQRRELTRDPGAAEGSAAVLPVGGGQGAQQPGSSSEMGDRTQE